MQTVKLCEDKMLGTEKPFKNVTSMQARVLNHPAIDH